MVTIELIPFTEFQRVRQSLTERYDRAAIIADMCRANTLAAVKLAGSGHLGSSLSAMDIVVWLYFEEMNIGEMGITSPDRDIYFSSKGHDVPGLYSVLYAQGLLPKEQFLNLRRLGGLDGHPDVGIQGIEANSGSLGMGISKGRGMAWAKRYGGLDGRVYVLTGDGELQEGQNYEALQSTLQQGIDNLTVIVDHNKLQSDKQVTEIVDLGNLEEKFAAFGWHVIRISGHDFPSIEQALNEAKSCDDRPQVIIADTIKGQGVSFMEHPSALKEGKGLYKWHAGAPQDEDYAAAHAEIIAGIQQRLADRDIVALKLEDVTPPPKTSSGVTAEFVADAYGQALVELAKTRKDIVVLDGDLAADCRVRDFEEIYPERFIENGIAEQDMVSMAGGLARMDLLPVVNSFASFLGSHANEQIYNNASEHSKIIYAMHYAGLIPAGPGKSHQSLRDIANLISLPNMLVLQPCNGNETKQVLKYCVEETPISSAIRLVIGPSPRRITLPDDYQLQYGRGVALTEGANAIMFAYGPVMLHEALTASEILMAAGVGLKVVNMPWLNQVDGEWLQTMVEAYDHIYVLEDHFPEGGLGDTLLKALSDLGILEHRHFKTLAVEGWPACGTPIEALQFHGLDGFTLAQRLKADVGETH